MSQKTKLLSSLILATLPLIILVVAFSVSVGKAEAYCLGAHPDCAHSGTLGYLSAGTWRVTISGLYGQYCDVPEQTQEKVKINYPGGRAWLSDPGGCCVQRGSGGLGCRLTSSTTFTTSGGNVSWVANWDSVHDYTFSKTKISEPTPPPGPNCGNKPVINIMEYVPTSPTPQDSMTFTVGAYDENTGDGRLEQIKVFIDGGWIGRCIWGAPHQQGSCVKSDAYISSGRRYMTCACTGGPYSQSNHTFEGMAIETDPCDRRTTQTLNFTVSAPQPDLTNSKLGRNVTQGQIGWVEEVSAEPGDIIEFSIEITSVGNTTAENVWVEDILPSKMNYQGDLKIDGVPSGGNIISGLNIGNLSPSQSKTITFKVRLDSTCFPCGTTSLVNTARTWADEVSEIEDTSTVNVTEPCWDPQPDPDPDPDPDLWYDDPWFNDPWFDSWFDPWFDDPWFDSWHSSGHFSSGFNYW